jgi:hypothetical protein
MLIVRAGYKQPVSGVGGLLPKSILCFEKISMIGKVT